MPQLTLFLAQNGIPEGMIAWLFILPAATTIVVIGRQVIGIKGVGISTPLLAGFAFSATGLQAGLIIFLTVFASGLVARSLLAKIRLLYLPKMSLVVTASTLVVMLVLPFLPYKSDFDFSFLAFALVALIVSAEQFAGLATERGLRKAAGIAIETALLAAAVFWLASSPYFKNIALGYPLFIVGGSIIINAILGKWTGLRISEYIRFNGIIFKK